MNMTGEQDELNYSVVELGLDEMVLWLKHMYNYIDLHSSFQSQISISISSFRHCNSRHQPSKRRVMRHDIGRRYKRRPRLPHPVRLHTLLLPLTVVRPDRIRIRRDKITILPLPRRPIQLRQVPYKRPLKLLPIPIPTIRLARLPQDRPRILFERGIGNRRRSTEQLLIPTGRARQLDQTPQDNALVVRPAVVAVVGAGLLVEAVVEEARGVHHAAIFKPEPGVRGFGRVGRAAGLDAVRE